MKPRQSGVTLVELMTAILILAILMGLAVPSFRQFAANSRVGAASSSLTTALNLARSEALRRASPVIACASSNQTTCSGSTDWSAGWIVFADPDGGGSPGPGANDLVQTWPALQGQITAASTVALTTYNAMGMTRFAGAAPATFTMGYPGCTGDQQRVAALSLSGSLQVSRRACP
jgi:type IV fimbrial biogenesis protein FimT